jgi:hypothetical protein
MEILKQPVFLADVICSAIKEYSALSENEQMATDAALPAFIVTALISADENLKQQASRIADTCADYGLLFATGDTVCYDCEKKPICVKCAKEFDPKRPAQSHDIVTHDPVRKPSCYASGVFAVVKAWGLDYHRDSALKYIARAGKKDSSKFGEDLENARYHLEYMIKIHQVNIHQEFEQQPEISDTANPVPPV